MLKDTKGLKSRRDGIFIARGFVLVMLGPSGAAYGAPDGGRLRTIKGFYKHVAPDGAASFSELLTELPFDESAN